MKKILPISTPISEAKKTVRQFITNLGQCNEAVSALMHAILVPTLDTRFFKGNQAGLFPLENTSLKADTKSTYPNLLEYFQGFSPKVVSIEDIHIETEPHGTEIQTHVARFKVVLKNTKSLLETTEKEVTQHFATHKDRILLLHSSLTERVCDNLQSPEPLNTLNGACSQIVDLENGSILRVGLGNKNGLRYSILEHSHDQGESWERVFQFVSEQPKKVD